MTCNIELHVIELHVYTDFPICINIVLSVVKSPRPPEGGEYLVLSSLLEYIIQRDPTLLWKNWKHITLPDMDWSI